MTRGRMDGLRYWSWGNDPGIWQPFHRDRRSFVRLVWGRPFYRPIAFPFRRNPWTEWRWFTVRGWHRDLLGLGLVIGLYGVGWTLAGVLASLYLASTYFFVSLRVGKLLLYRGAKVYAPGADHTYARPGDRGKAAVTLSFRIGWEPFR